MQFHDRRHAGRELAARLRIQQEKGALAHPVVLALPRGGVVVAREIADALEAPLDVVVARTIGAPSGETVGVGALTGEDPPLLDTDALDRLGLSEGALADVVARERAEARRREELYRRGRPAPDLRDHTAIVVDDGLATGATARAVLRRIRRQSPERVVLAVPVCSPEAAGLLRGEADELLCLCRPGTFLAVSQWYERFDQVTDEEVLRTLREG
ncbi:phosphoribosyltransferase [Streptomyces cinerochromogenes]|uniref:phosphoribosyltransferase n=1 Tax=Streptomyces cinerochromogenes TaxID=66422 RepID=UPI0033B147E8